MCIIISRVSFFVVVVIRVMNNLVTKRSLSLSLFLFLFLFQVVIAMAAVSSSSSSSSPFLLSSTSNARRRHGTATQPFFVLSLLFLLGGLFVLVKVRTTSDAFCKKTNMSNRLESEREEEGDDREMFFASSNGREVGRGGGRR